MGGRGQVSFGATAAAKNHVTDITFNVSDEDLTDRELDLVITAARLNARHFIKKSGHRIHANNYRRYALALQQLQRERDEARAIIRFRRTILEEVRHAITEESQGSDPRVPSEQPVEPDVLEGGPAGERGPSV